MANAISPEYTAWNDLLQGLQKAANLGRIPLGEELETASSQRISELLNPPEMFPDISRSAAETGAMRGIAGSPASYGTTLRMTDDERLKRIALGQDMLTTAVGRNPSAPLPDPGQFMLTPYQEALLELQRREMRLKERATNEALRPNRARQVRSAGLPSSTGSWARAWEPAPTPFWNQIYPVGPTHGTRDLPGDLAGLYEGGGTYTPSVSRPETPASFDSYWTSMAPEYGAGMNFGSYTGG